MLNREIKWWKETWWLEGYFDKDARETTLEPEWNAGEANEHIDEKCSRQRV